MRMLLLFALLGVTLAEDWQPILPESSLTYATYKSPERSLSASPHLKILNRRPQTHNHYMSTNKLSSILGTPAPMSDTCSIYKVSMNQELFYQYLEYEKDLPDLKEFTLCMWTKFHNHTEDHPLFSYAVGDNPKEISTWISNTNDYSFFSMAVHGQTFFRLNYPLKINVYVVNLGKVSGEEVKDAKRNQEEVKRKGKGKVWEKGSGWYHSCQSWNGKTGEWQIWVNAERVGRGFHNRLVGHVIKGGGVAVTGQEQSLLYNKDKLDPPKQQSGLMGEITMLQLYHVALTAGKAHKDHKHHHAHHFKHDGTPVESITQPPPEAPAPQAKPLGNGNFLVAGQLQRAPNLNLAGAQQMVPVILPNGQQIQQPYVNGQLGTRIVSEQLAKTAQVPPNPITAGQTLTIVPAASSQNRFESHLNSLGGSKGTTVVLSGSLLNPANVQYIDDSHKLYRRDSKRDKRDNPEKELAIEAATAAGKKDKRGLVALSDGSIVDEALLSPNLLDNKDDDDLFQQSLLNGLAGVVGNQPVQDLQRETVDEREPAEAEVKAVMQICSGCAPEPFKKVLVLSWRATPKKLYSGAHYYKGLPICKAF